MKLQTGTVPPKKVTAVSHFLSHSPAPYYTVSLTLLTLQHNPPPLQAHTEAVPILDNVFNAGGRLQMNSIKFPEFFIFSLLSAFRAEVAFNTRSNKTKSRSCPTRAVDENLSIRLSISPERHASDFRTLM